MIHKGLVDHPLVSDILESHHFVYNSLIGVEFLGVEFLGRVFFFDRVNFCYIYYSKQNYFMFFYFRCFVK